MSKVFTGADTLLVVPTASEARDWRRFVANCDVVHPGIPLHGHRYQNLVVFSPRGERDDVKPEVWAAYVETAKLRIIPGGVSYFR